MSHDWKQAFIAGSISGTISSLLFQPLDVTKTRLQSVRKRELATRVTYCAVVTNVYRTDGVLGFWRGLTPSLVRCIPGVGMYFCSLNYLTQRFDPDKRSVPRTMVIGATARTTATVCLIPLSVLKTRFESGEYSSYRGLFHAIKSIHKNEGIRVLTVGLIPTIIRDVPFSALFYLFYTQMKSLTGVTDTDRKSSVKTFFCGVTAGCMASFITHPADVIKTYAQLYPAEFSRISLGLIFVHKKFGVSGFYTGLIVRLVRRTLVTSMSWTLYEKITERFRL